MTRFMRRDLDNKYGLLEVQDAILGIVVDFDAFCNANEIEYCLMGGSALGAKRHGGFIPWDDDLDVFMTPDNYERFRDVFLKTGDSDKYYLQEWGATNGMVTIAKIRLNGTSYIEESVKDWDIHHGIYIDIFILHRCPNNIISQIHQWFWAKYAITKGLAIREKGRHNGIKGFLISIARLLPERFLIKHALKEVYKYRNIDSKYCCNFMGKAVFKKGIYNRDWFNKTAYVPFETTQLRVPEGLHSFLLQRFGDYMKIPSPERIKYEQHAESWDFHHQKKVSSEYKDESKLI